MENKKIRIAVMGAGAVGGYFGARLAAAGHDVAFIARGTHLEAMQKQGLKIKSFRGNLHIRSRFASNPEEVGPVDLVLFCVKSYDTEEAGKKLAPLMNEKTLILSLQNGVDNPDKIVKLWDKSRTLAGVVYIGARISAPGAIEHSAEGRIVFGEPDGEVSDQTKLIQQIFSAAQIPCSISAEIRKVLWGKLVWNAPFCAIACLARATVKEILESDSLRELAVSCMEEVREAAKCRGFDLSPDLIAQTLKVSESLGDFKPSMLQDLEAGKPLEYEAFNGVVVELLRRAGKSAPINEIFYGSLKFLDKRIRGAEAR
jgi:2-dehydropantoate 2-reductase